MSVESIQSDVKAFLFEHIETHEQLAAILLLRETASQSWTSGSVAQSLGIPTSAADEALQHLDVQGLIVTDEQTPQQFKYAPRTPELAKQLDHLADAQKEHWFDIVKLVGDNAIMRIRNSVLHAFSDAFVVNRKKGSDG